MSEDECGKCFPVTSDAALHHDIDRPPNSCFTLCDRSVTAIACDEAVMHKQPEVTLVEPPALQSSEVRAISFTRPAERFSQQDGNAAASDFAFTRVRRLGAH